MFSTGFALSRNGEVCTVDASPAEHFFLEKLGQYVYEPLVLCSIFSSRHVAAGDFLGALDDEEFFVAEGSGSGGVAGSLTPR